MFYDLLKKISPTYKVVRSELQNLVDTNSSSEEIELFLTKLCASYPKQQLKYKKAFFEVMKDVDTLCAIKYAEEVVAEDSSDISLLHVLAIRQQRVGNIKRYLELIELLNTILVKQKKSLFRKSYPKYSIVRLQLQNLVDTNSSSEEIELFLTKLCASYPKQQLKYKKAFFEVMKDVDTLCAIKYAEEVVAEDSSDISLLHVLAIRQQRVGNIKRYLELIEFLDNKLLQRNKIPIKKKFSLEIFKGIVLFMLDEKTKEEIEVFIDKELINHKRYKQKIAKNAFSFLKDKHVDLALKYADIVLEKVSDKKFIQVLFTRAKRIEDKERMSRYSQLLNSPLAAYYRLLLENENRLSRINKNLENKTIIKVSEDLKWFLEKYPLDKEVVYFIFGELYYPYNKKVSIMYLENALTQKKVFFSYEKLFDLYVKHGLYLKALKSLPYTIQCEHLVKKANLIRDNLSLMDNKSLLIYPLEYSYESTNKIFYILYNTLPYHSGGYAIRSHEIMKEFNTLSKKFSMIGVSRLAYPNDIVKHIAKDTVPMEELVDNQTYLRLISDVKKGSMSYLSYIEIYSHAIMSLAKKEKPRILHAASNFLNGLATVRAAKSLGLKSIYEIRGLWEVTAISNSPELEGSDLYTLQVYLETQAALGANKVITITKALKKEMIRRGVPESKIVIIPNGVVSNRFIPLSTDICLHKELQLENKIVIGYVGTMVEYEGLDYLIEAINILVNKKYIKNIVVLMIGDGKISRNLQARVKMLRLDKYFTFTGRVNHEDVQRYYSLIDITPFPRKGLPVCEMVSPLKPLEAMSMQKAVLASNVEALVEMVKDGHTGLIFEKDNIDDLADKLQILIEDKNLRKKLGEEARVWVQKEREWSAIVEKLNNVYEEMENE